MSAFPNCQECRHAYVAMSSEPCKTCLEKAETDKVVASKFAPKETTE